jgi:hypothetical protein
MPAGPAIHRVLRICRRSFGSNCVRDLMPAPSCRLQRRSICFRDSAASCRPICDAVCCPPRTTALPPARFSGLPRLRDCPSRLVRSETFPRSIAHSRQGRAPSAIRSLDRSQIHQRPRSSSNKRSLRCREVSSSFTRLPADFTFNASSCMPKRNAARNSLGAF